MLNAAKLGSIKILELEQLLDQKGTREVELPHDHAAIKGDVRDIILKPPHNNAFGLSAKHNHWDCKHPRINETTGVAHWFQSHLSSTWTQATHESFEFMTKHLSEPWATHSHFKTHTIYPQILNAALHDLFYGLDSPLAVKTFFNFIVGTQDFYKIVYLPKPNQIQLQLFNLHGTMNNHAPLIAPTELLDFNLPRSNTLELHFNNQWSIKLRLHNADSVIKKTGLKFSATLLTTPHNTQCFQLPPP